MACLAQGEDYNWIFGACAPESGNMMYEQDMQFQFNSDTFTISTFCEDLNYYLSNTSISDGNGQLMYFSNGNEIRSGNNLSIVPGAIDFQPLWEPFSMEQGSLILPDPGNANGHYFIQSDFAFYPNPNFEYTVGSNNFRYTYLAWNAESPIITEKEIVFENDTLSMGGHTSTRHANGRDWWLLENNYFTNHFKSYLISPEGISLYDNQTIGEKIKNGTGRACFTPDGNWYAITMGEEFFDSRIQLSLYNFDRCTGELSNPIQKEFIGIGFINSISFSPNSKLMYVVSKQKIFQFDLESEDIFASELLVAEYDGFTYEVGGVNYASRFGASQLTPTNKIFITPSTGSFYLHVIDQPDVKGVGCNVLQHHIQLPYLNDASIPNLPYFRSAPVYGSACDTLRPIANFDYLPEELIYQFQDLTQRTPTAWHWDFGEGGSSSVQHPEHNYAASGEYEVCLIATNAIGSDTVCQTLQVVTSINNIEQLNIQVIPNPTDGELHLVIPPLITLSSIQLFDVTGKLLNTWDPTINFEFNKYTNGLYLLILTDDKGRRQIERIVKQ